MTRGPRKHLKRQAAPSHWCMDKLTGVFAPKPSAGPHKHRECLPLAILLRNRLKLALTYAEAKMILMQKYVQVDGKIRTENTFPAGFMDVVKIDKMDSNYRLLFNTKGRFSVHRIADVEAEYKLCRVQKVDIGKRSIAYASTHDGRTVRFTDPQVKANDTLRIDLATGDIVDFAKFENGNVAMVTGGHNIGRVGIVEHRERHPGSFEIVHLRDSRGHTFATRVTNVFIIGKGDQPWISLPKGDGIKLSIVEDRESKLR